MANNFDISAGSGTTIATTETGGVHYQRLLIAHDATTPTVADQTTPLPVGAPYVLPTGGFALDPARLTSLALSLDAGGATYDAIGDYSVTAAQWQLKPTAASHILATTLVVTVANATGFDVGKAVYGGRATLANGIDVEIRDLADEDSILQTLLTPNAKNTRDWARAACRVQVIDNGSATMLQFEIPLAPAGAWLDIYSPSSGVGDYLAVHLNDNMSTVGDMHSFTVRGFTLAHSTFADHFVSLA